MAATRDVGIHWDMFGISFSRLGENSIGSPPGCVVEVTSTMVARLRCRVAGEIRVRVFDPSGAMNPLPPGLARSLAGELRNAGFEKETPVGCCSQQRGSTAVG